MLDAITIGEAKNLLRVLNRVVSDVAVVVFVAVVAAAAAADEIFDFLTPSIRRGGGRPWPLGLAHNSIAVHLAANRHSGFCQSSCEDLCCDSRDCCLLKTYYLEDSWASQVRGEDREDYWKRWSASGWAQELDFVVYTLFRAGLDQAKKAIEGHSSEWW